MREQSAGLLMYRRSSTGIQVLLVHPGGPFFRDRDLGAWSIPKGLYEGGEDPLEAAQREFLEETGVQPHGPYEPLGQCRLSSGKIVLAWAFEGECDAERCRSNTFTMEWPPKSGRSRTFPEVDRAGWFDLELARAKIAKGQAPFIDRLAETVAAT